MFQKNLQMQIIFCVRGMLLQILYLIRILRRPVDGSVTTTVNRQILEGCGFIFYSS